MTYLLKNVVQRVRRVDGEADQDDVRVGVGEGSEPVIIFLSSRIPQGQLDVLVVDLDIGDIVLENGGDVDLERRDMSAWSCLSGSTQRCRWFPPFSVMDGSIVMMK